MLSSTKIRAAISAALLFLFFQPQISVAAEPTHLSMWVVRGQLTSKEKIDRVISFAEKNNFTDIFLQVRGRGDAFYKSMIVPFSELVRDRKFDPLEYAIEKAHRSGLNVHAWINIYLLWSSEKKPVNRRHLLYIHPEWCAVDADGVRDVQRPHKDFKSNGSEGIYLSPLHSEVKEYLLSVINELISNYNIDGLHFDYIRYPNKDYDYHEVGRRNFKEKYSIDPILLSITNSSYYKGWDPKNLNKLMDTWKQYRCDAISALIKETRNLIALKGKPIEFSAAVKANPVNARNFFFQDWAVWIKNGWLDFAVPMNYTKDGDQFEHVLKVIDNQGIKGKVWMGIAVYNQNRYDAFTKTIITLYNGYDDLVYFSYKTFADKPAYFPTIKKAFSMTAQ